jgi:4-aminobutyrate aminotransferase
MEGSSALPTRIIPAVKRHCQLVIDKGAGSEVWTEDGKRYLDYTSGIGVLSTGHCHPHVVKAVQAQATKISHAQQGCYFNSTTNRLIERLVPVVPKGLDSFFFCNSGAEAVEGALKIARQAKRRDTVIAFLGGYHGRTAGAIAVTSSGSGYRGERAGPLPSGTAWARYPYEHAGITAKDALESLDLLLLQQAKASEIAAVIIEPVLGEGGYVVPPEGFMRKLRIWCTDHDILLIADEVQCGFGRTGKQWACEHFGIIPDILVSAKGIASGYPLAMVASKPELTKDQHAGCMGGTYGGNAVACAAALATLDVFEQESILENVTQRGAQLKDKLRSMKPEAEKTVGNVRGLGLMVAIEFDQDIVKKGFAAVVVRECLDRNVLVLTTGHRETVRVIPPLTTTAAEIDEFSSVLEQSILAVLAKAAYTVQRTP